MTGSTPPARARAESKSATYAAESAAKKEEPGAAPDPPDRYPSMVVTEPKDYTGAPKQRTDRDNDSFIPNDQELEQKYMKNDYKAKVN